MAYLGFFLSVLASLVSSSLAQKCQVSVSGIILQDHVFSSFRDEDIHECYEKCKEKIGCMSINFYRDSLMCELNNRTVAAKPSKKRDNSMGVYFEKPKPAAIGSHEELPGESCMEIKNSTHSPSSGVYWIKHAHQSKKTYCNMSTGVADPCRILPCKNQGTCKTLDEVTYNCTCVAPFTGKNCQTKDSCSPNPCTNGGTCVNSERGYTCTCRAGFIGKTCEIVNDAPCVTYTNITDATRNVNYVTVSSKCDSGIAVKWYRLTGSAGQRMPSTCAIKSRCNTDATGWLSDTHPDTSQGIVSRKACFNWSNNCCNWSKVIRVRNCGAFYVYEFQPPGHCSLRYCGTN